MHNFVRAGFEVTIHDLKPELVADLVALGAKSAATPRAVAEQSDIIASVVMNDRQTLEVFLEGDGTGVLTGAVPGSLIVIHSTVSPALCKQVAHVAAIKGIGVIDAAVTGYRSDVACSVVARTSVRALARETVGLFQTWRRLISVVS